MTENYDYYYHYNHYYDLYSNTVFMEKQDLPRLESS